MDTGVSTDVLAYYLGNCPHTRHPRDPEGKLDL